MFEVSPSCTARPSLKEVLCSDRCFRIGHAGAGESVVSTGGLETASREKTEELNAGA